MSFNELWTEILVQENKREIETLLENSVKANMEVGNFVVDALTLGVSSYNKVEQGLFVSALVPPSPESGPELSVHLQRRTSPFGQ